MSYCFATLLTLLAAMAIVALSAYLYFNKEAVGRRFNSIMGRVRIPQLRIPMIPNYVPRYAISAIATVAFGWFMLTNTYHPCKEDGGNDVTVQIGKNIMKTIGLDCGCEG